MPLSKMAHYVRPDEMHQAFNFGYLATDFNAQALRAVIDESLEAFGGVGSPSTWVLSNHDVVRHASRFGTDFVSGAHPTGIGPLSPNKPDTELGLKKARAATALMLALPGSAYLYQGEELGLPEAIDIPDADRQDPTFFRTQGERYGRDGCRVPLPWDSAEPANGFNSTGETWLPQPPEYAELARAHQSGVDGSTLELYRSLLALRAEENLGKGTVAWNEGYPDSVIAFDNGAITVISNTGSQPVELPAGELVVASQPVESGVLPGYTTAWVRTR
jgi:alpha-glucosidase